MSLQDLFKEIDLKLYESLRKLDTEINKKVNNYVKYLETGDIEYLKKQMKLLQGEDGSSENIEPNSMPLPKRTTRQNTVKTVNNCLSAPTIAIKMEKMSIAPPPPTNSDVTRNDISVDDMPAPTMPPPRKKKIKEEPVTRATRTKTRNNKYQDELEVDRGKPSEIIIQNTTVTMIDITEEKDCENEKKKGNTTEAELEKTIISTRTRTRQQKKNAEENKEVESKKDDKNDFQIITKKAKQQNNDIKSKKIRQISSSSDENKENRNDQTANKESNNAELSAKIQNTTMVLVPVLDRTVVVEHPKIVKNNVVNNKGDSSPFKTKSTRDQGDCKTPLNTKSKKTCIDKKIEAFEKLDSASRTNSASKIPVHVDSQSKTKPYTSFLPKSCSTFRINVTPQSSKSNSCLSTKTLSTLKASQAENREREKRRQEKELKVQQQRELIQKEKEKLLEMQKLKLEQQIQVIAEKEKLQKDKEEALRMKLLAKNKTKLANPSESSQNGGKNVETKRTQQNHIPIYMMTEPPLLPTDDCYDSGNDALSKKNIEKPTWCRDEYLKKPLYAQLVAGEKIKNSLFCCQTHSPDLTEIFEIIHPKILKRTSSANWREPPRYTLFSVTNDILFSEDSE